VTDIYVPRARGRIHSSCTPTAQTATPRSSPCSRARGRGTAYVVAIPNFPLTSDKSGGSVVLGDYAHQPTDLHFILDQVLRLAATSDTPLPARIDRHHIGLSGLSLGGATAYGFGFNTCCHDARITAVIIMSGIKLPFGNDPYRFDKPILIFHGTADPVIPYSTAGAVYASAARPKYFVTLLGAVTLLNTRTHRPTRPSRNCGHTRLLERLPESPGRGPGAPAGRTPNQPRSARSNPRPRSGRTAAGRFISE